jgi:hypothetical protein
MTMQELTRMIVVLLAILLLKTSAACSDTGVWKPASYRGVVVSQSSEKQLISILGKPNWIGKEQDTGLPILTFSVTEPVPGKLTVYITHGLVTGMILSPTSTLSRQDIMRLFGAKYKVTHYAIDECATEGGTAPIYESSDGPITHLEYRDRGLAVVMQDSEVQAILFEGKPTTPNRSRCGVR